MAERGRLVLPAALRRRLAIKSGDRLTMTVEGDGSIRMFRQLDLIQSLRGSLKARARGRSPVDDLIAERRAEAAREDGE